jgi:hypothetical protein
MKALEFIVLLIAFACLPLVACAEPAPVPPPATEAEARQQAAIPAQTQSPVPAQPLLVVHKNPSCGCCGLWIEHMHAHGFEVEVRDIDDMGPVKERVGVPAGMGSCHTAEVAGYFIEGHVPAADVQRLLAERPEALGLTVPGMPLGSPGMEVPDGRVQPYEVVLVGKDGSTSTWSRHGD